MTPAPFDAELARRATEIPGWRVIPGMLARRYRGAYRILRPQDTEDGSCPSRVEPLVGLEDVGAEWLPDYRDPATAGCLEELLGESMPQVFADGVTVQAFPPGGDSTPLCRGACPGESRIRTAIAIGRWPGGVA